jgi:hypothetical protein
MKNLQTLANELAASKMTLLVSDQLNVKGGWSSTGGTSKNKSVKIKSVKSKSVKSGGYGCGCSCS